MLKLKDILNELKSKELGNYVFAEPPSSDRPNGAFPDPSLWQYFDYPSAIRDLIAFQGGETEKNTEEEQDLLLTLMKWLHLPRHNHAKELGNMMEKLVVPLANKYPKIFKPTTPNGTSQYRGTAYKRSEYFNVLTDIAKKLGSEAAIDSLPLVKHGDVSFIEVGNINYHPRSDIQSWSSSAGVAVRFSVSSQSRKEKGDYSIVLHTKQDDSFYFNQKALEILFGGHEDEVIHFGRTYKNDVTLLVFDPFTDGKATKSFMKKILNDIND